MRFLVFLALVISFSGSVSAQAQTQTAPATAPNPQALGQMVNQLLANPALLQAMQAMPAATAGTSAATRQGATPQLPAVILDGQGSDPSNAMLPGLASMSEEQKAQLGANIQTLVNRHLSPQEQDALRKFQQSPEGQSIIKKLPGLMKDLGPLLVQLYLTNGFATGQ
jgi:hypothetical protein